MTKTYQAKGRGIFFSWGIVLFLSIHVFSFSALFIKPDLYAILMLVGFFLIRGFAITGGYHRYFAHQSFKTNRFFQFLVAFVGGMSCQMGVLWWVSHHRHHHQHSDEELDIHSAKRDGFFWAHFGWVLQHLHEYNPKKVRDLAVYPELGWLDRNHFVPPMCLAAFCFVLHGWVGVVWGFLVSTLVLYHATFTVNSFCHTSGSQRYDTGDASRNNRWLALITLGESWHNNHHHSPASCRHGFYWWEIDLTYYLIKLLSKLRMVHNLKLPVDSTKEVFVTATSTKSETVDGAEPIV